MRRFVLHFATLFCIIVSIVPSARAQISKTVGLLKAQVTLNNGAPATGVNFTIFKGTEKLTSTKSNSEGKLTSILQPDAMYRIAVTSTGYMYHEDTLRVPALEQYQEFPLHIVLTPLADGQMFDLSQPVFRPKSRDIDPAAMADLDRIANELKHNSKLSVSVKVYPDAPVRSKKDAAQQKLVAGRETSIRSFFLGKSIAASRFSVESITSEIPPGRFPTGASAAPVESKKKKKKVPAEPALFPQYVEITAHLVS